MSVLRNTILAGIGAAKLAGRGASALYDDLIREGEADQSRTKEKLMQWADSAERGTTDFRQKFSEEAGKAKENMGHWAQKVDFATRSEIRNLEAKIAQLTEMVERLTRDLSGGQQSAGTPPPHPQP